MSLSELKFTTDKRQTPAFRASPSERRRAAILNSIETQRVLLEAERNNVPANLTKMVKKFEDGVAVQTSVVRKPRKWWFKNPQGQLILEILFSNRAISIGGKTAILAGDFDGVANVLNIIAEAVSAGELDKALEAVKPNRKPKKAA